MTTKAMKQEVKTRVPSEHREALVAIAEQRHLDLSDIIREALREYLERPEIVAVLEQCRQRQLFT